MSFHGSVVPAGGGGKYVVVVVVVVEDVVIICDDAGGAFVGIVAHPLQTLHNDDDDADNSRTICKDIVMLRLSFNLLL